MDLFYISSVVLKVWEIWQQLFNLKNALLFGKNNIMVQYNYQFFSQID